MMEAEDSARNVLFMLHGGPKNFDCWMTKTADQILAAPASLPAGLQQRLTPVLEWMQRPREVIDHLIEQMGKIGAWDYNIISNDNTIKVVDGISGHVVEELLMNPDNMADLTKKYGREG